MGDSRSHAARCQLAECLLGEYSECFGGGANHQVEMHAQVDPAGTMARLVVLGLEKLFPCQVLGHDMKHVDGTNLAVCQRCEHDEVIPLPASEEVEVE